MARIGRLIAFSIFVLLMPLTPNMVGRRPAMCRRPAWFFGAQHTFCRTACDHRRGSVYRDDRARNALRPDTGLHALLARAGAGDEILLMQLYENRNWGDTTSNPIADPNPRLQALIDAARRGARVRVLLDSYFDDAQALRSNQATVDYLGLVAKAEGLDLHARLGNPTQAGLHAKLVLVRLGAETWSAIGSLNGGEVSYKLNREVVLMVDYPAIYSRLYAVFDHDWGLGE